MIIEDGKGNGKSAEVNEENRLLVNAVAASPEHHINHDHGEAFSANFTVTPTGPGDCFLYIKNTNEKELIIEGFGIKLAANEYIDIIISDIGDSIGGTDITPTNLNAGSGNIADGIFQYGVDITGLSGGNQAYRMYHASSLGTEYHNFEMDIILPKNGTFSMYIETGTTELSGYIDLAYHD